MIGRQIGHYRIVEQIGQGGMGVVYLAEDTRLGRRVALKVLPAEMSGDAARRARFEREARAVAALNHPNIVTLHAVEEMEGVSFLTMELVQGRRLSELLVREGLPLAKLLDWSLAVADALVAAHKAGVVHRDLKPDNIMITHEGRLKVLDFGLAKLRESALETAGTALPTGSITEEGKILGTVSYMSPEQAEGKPLDHRSDIFSFGVVLYEMATGRRPFQGETAISTISSILKDTPQSADEINTLLPRHLGRIVRRCLAKEPERRFQSTDDLRNELAELKEESDSATLTRERPASPGGPSQSITPPRGARRMLLLAGLAIPLALVAGWLWLGQPGVDQAPRRDGPGAYRMSRVTTDGKVVLAAISPEGRYVAYVRRDGSTQSLRLRQLATGDEVQVVPPTEGAISAPSFSGDGNYLHYVFVEQGRVNGWIYRVSVLGGTPRRIVDGAFGVSGSPDGALLAFTAGAFDDSFLRIAGAEGESPRDLLERKGRDHFDSDAAWSPDGKSLAIVSHRFGEPQRIVVIDPASGSERPVATPALRNIDYLTWIPGKDALIVAGSERPVTQMGSAQIWEVSTQGDVTPITRDLNDYASVSITGDASAVAAVQVERRSGIAVATVTDGVPGPFSELLPVSAARSGGAGLAWLSEDRLAHGAPQREDWQIHLADVSTRTSRPLTSGAPHRNPAASRDGRTLVVVRDDQEKAGLWRLDPGTGRGEKLTAGEFEGFPVVTSDGSWVVYSAIGDAFRLLKVSSKGGDPVELVRGTVWCVGVIDGDVDALCLRAEASGQTTPVLVPLSGGEPRPLSGVPPAATLARVSPDGRAIAYLMSREGASEIWSLPLQGGEARRLARFEGEEIGDFAWSPGGSRIAVVKTSRSGDVVLLSRDPS